VSAKVLSKLLKKSGKNSGKMVGKEIEKSADELRMLSRRSGGFIPKAVGSEMTRPIDTSGVPGGNIESKLLALQEYGTPNMASAPRSDALQKITHGLRSAERGLSGSPGSLLFPRGLTEYLEAVNNPLEKPTNRTRVMGLLDLM
jgi:hypothetical protein